MWHGALAMLALALLQGRALAKEGDEDKRDLMPLILGLLAGVLLSVLRPVATLQTGQLQGSKEGSLPVGVAMLVAAGAWCYWAFAESLREILHAVEPADERLSYQQGFLLWQWTMWLIALVAEWLMSGQCLSLPWVYIFLQEALTCGWPMWAAISWTDDQQDLTLFQVMGCTGILLHATLRWAAQRYWRLRYSARIQDQAREAFHQSWFNSEPLFEARLGVLLANPLDAPAHPDSVHGSDTVWANAVLREMHRWEYPGVESLSLALAVGSSPSLASLALWRHHNTLERICIGHPFYASAPTIEYETVMQAVTGICFPKLRSLDWKFLVSAEDAVAAWLEKHSTLTSLHIERLDPTERMLQVVTQLPHLSKLSLGVISSDSDALSLLSRCTGLRELTVQGVEEGDALTFGRLPWIIRTMPQLERLSLGEDMGAVRWSGRFLLENRGVAALAVAEGVARCPRMRSVQCLGNLSMPAMTALLSAHQPELDELTLHQFLAEEEEEEGWELVDWVETAAACVRAQNHVESVSLCTVFQHPPDRVLEALQGCSALTSLSVESMLYGHDVTEEHVSLGAILRVVRSRAPDASRLKRLRLILPVNEECVGQWEDTVKSGALDHLESIQFTAPMYSSQASPAFDTLVAGLEELVSRGECRLRQVSLQVLTPATAAKAAAALVRHCRKLQHLSISGMKDELSRADIETVREQVRQSGSQLQSVRFSKEQWSEANRGALSDELPCARRYRRWLERLRLLKWRRALVVSSAG
jgi:hypothetical protein